MSHFVIESDCFELAHCGHCSLSLMVCAKLRVTNALLLSSATEYAVLVLQYSFGRIGHHFKERIYMIGKNLPHDLLTLKP